MEWLRDATNALEEKNSLSNKGPNDSSLNENRCFFFVIFGEEKKKQIWGGFHKGLNISFLNHKKWFFFSKFKISFHKSVIRQILIIQKDNQ